MKVEHHVKIGQIKAARHGEILKTVLGSCVGIALFVREKNLYIMAHCLLPEAPPGTPNQEAKYVSQAVPNMIRMLKIPEDEHPRIEAVVVGGGHVIDIHQRFAKYVVGDENLKAARRYLSQYHIPIIAVEPGLDHGTKFILDCSDGTYAVEKLNKAQ